MLNICDLPNAKMQIFYTVCTFLLLIQTVKSSGCNKKCENKGECKMKNGIETCLCPPGYTGENCNLNFGACVPNRCKNNGTCTNLFDNYKCKCKKGYAGRQCQNLDPCENYPNLCRNGRCITKQNGGYYCKCPKQFVGKQCETRLTKFFCPDSYKDRRLWCMNKGECINFNQTLSCKCDREYEGKYCEILVDPAVQMARQKCDKISSFNLLKSPKCRCLNGGICNGPERECVCKIGFTGKNCETVVNNWKSKTTLKPAKYKSIGEPSTNLKCSVQCKSKFNNAICDQECNTQYCGFDGQDCNPWKRCYQKTSFNCQDNFRDGICNPQCNSVECFFDGSDCEDSKCASENFCTLNYQNGRCDYQCNNPQCGFDGGDCTNIKKNNKSTNTADNDSFFPTSNFEVCAGSNKNNHTISKDGRLKKKYFLDIILSTDKETFEKHSRDFLRKLSIILKAVLKIEYIKEIYDEQGNLTVRIELDPMECINYGGQCFASLTQMIKYLEASIKAGKPMALPFKMKSIKPYTIQDDHKENKKSPSNFQQILTVIFILGFVICGLIISFNVLTRQNWNKKRSNVQTSGTWTPPDGYSNSSLSTGVPSWPKIMNTTNNDANQFDQHSRSIYPSTDLLGNNSIQIQNFKHYQNVQYAPLMVPKNGSDCRKRKRSDISPNNAAFKAISDNLQIFDGLNPISGTNQTHLLQLIDSCASKTMQNCPDVTKAKYRNLAASNNLYCDNNDENNLGCYVNEQGESLLHIAARLNAGPVIVKRLHKLWPNMLESLDQWGRTPYITAVASSSVETIECLNGLAKQRRKEKKQAHKLRQEILTSLGSNENDEGLKKNMEKSSQQSQQPTASTTVLIEAVKVSSDVILDMLLDEGCSSVTALDKDGRSVVHWAAMMDNVGVLVRLSKVKAFQKLVEQRDNQDKSALCLAAQEGSVNAAIYLADAAVRLWSSKNNAPQNQAKHDGDNTESAAPCPIDIALENGYTDLAETLKTKLSVMSSCSNSKHSRSKSAVILDGSNSNISKPLSTIQEDNNGDGSIDNHRIENQENLDHENIDEDVERLLNSPTDFQNLDHILDIGNPDGGDHSFSENKESNENITPSYNPMNHQSDNQKREPIFPPIATDESSINQFSENQSMKISTPTKSTNSSSELSPNFPPIMLQHKSKSSSRNGRESNISVSSISSGTMEPNGYDLSFPQNGNKIPTNIDPIENMAHQMPMQNNPNLHYHRNQPYYPHSDFTQHCYNHSRPNNAYYHNGNNNNLINVYNNQIPQPNANFLQQQQQQPHQQLSQTNMYKQQYMMYPNTINNNANPYNINQPPHNLYNI